MIRHRLNVVGPFYVTDRCCTLCGVPWDGAPELFAYDVNDVKHCWVAKQPETPEELARMLDVVNGQELDCIRYAGRDPEILKRLHAQRSGHLCDVVTDPATTRS